MARHRRPAGFEPGAVPLLRVTGNARACGSALGETWAAALRQEAEHAPAIGRPWWRSKALARVVDRYVPYLPELYTAMAKAAGVPAERLGAREITAGRRAGCTSFAINPRQTLAGAPISGQTKDTPSNRVPRFVVLALTIKGGPAILTLTYPGWLFGHGFVRGGCSLFRNSLYAGSASGRLPYEAWGLLATHCPTVEDAVALARKHGVEGAFHVTIADEHGGIVGVEGTSRGLATLRPRAGLYTHANAVCAPPTPRKGELRNEFQTNSRAREERLRQRLRADTGRLTPQLVYAALMDHEGEPVGICRHQSPESLTTAAVIVEPTRGLLHVTRGPACSHWPTTYSL